MADCETGNKRHKAGEAVFGFGITDLVLKNFYFIPFFFLQSSFTGFILLKLDWFFFSWIFNQSIHFFFSIWFFLKYFFYLFSWLNYFSFSLSLISSVLILGLVWKIEKKNKKNPGWWVTDLHPCGIEYFFHSNPSPGVFLILQLLKTFSFANYQKQIPNFIREKK